MNHKSVLHVVGKMAGRNVFWLLVILFRSINNTSFFFLVSVQTGVLFITGAFGIITLFLDI